MSACSLPPPPPTMSQKQATQKTCNRRLDGSDVCTVRLIKEGTPTLILAPGAGCLSLKKQDCSQRCHTNRSSDACCRLEWSAPPIPHPGSCHSSIPQIMTLQQALGHLVREVMQGGWMRQQQQKCCVPHDPPRPTTHPGACAVVFKANALYLYRPLMSCLVELSVCLNPNTRPKPHK